VSGNTISLRLNSSLAKIFRPNIHSPNGELRYTNGKDSFAYNIHHFSDKKITTQKAIELLSKNTIQVGDEDAAVIVDFLYHVAQCYNKQDSLKP
jgi:hypothetical protein